MELGHPFAINTKKKKNTFLDNFFAAQITGMLRITGELASITNYNRIIIKTYLKISAHLHVFLVSF
jgi:hypothetical protein